MTNSSDRYVYKPGSEEDPLADYRKTMERRFWIGMKHGKNTREFFEEVAAQGLSMEGDEEKIQELAEAETRSAAAETKDGLTTHVGPDGKGGMEATITFTRVSKEKGINAAIKSLGDRTGDDPADISNDFKKALRERDLGLDDDVRLQIASALAEGDDIVVGVDQAGGPN